MTVSDTSKPSRLMAAVGIVVLSAALYIVLFGGAASVTSENVTRHLQRVSAQWGPEGKFSHRSMRLEGWGFNRHAVLDDVRFAFAERLALETRRLRVLPDPVSRRQLVFELSEPVNLIKDGRLRAAVSFPEPAQYVHVEGYEKGEAVIVQKLRLPPRLAIALAERDIVISYDSNPIVRRAHYPDRREMEAEYEFFNVTVRGDDGGVMARLDSLVGRLSEAPGRGGTLSVAMADLELPGRRPYSLMAEFSYQPGRPGIEVRRFLLTDDVFRIRAAGARVDIDHLPALLAGEKGAGALLGEAAGRPVAGLETLSLPLHRDKNGKFFIGALPLDRLLAAIDMR